MYFLQLKILGIQGSNNFKLVETALKSLSAQEATSALVTTTLTDAEKIRILISKGVTEAEAKKILATAESTAANVAAAGSTDLLTAASLRLKAAIQGIGATIKTHPILAAVTAAVAVIAGVAKGVDYIMTKSERLSDKLSETKETISETTENLNSLESKLSDTKGRIDELNSMSSLTIVEQQELSNLKEVTAQLERQIELEKTRKRIENRQATEDFVNWFDSDIHTYGEYNYKGQGSAEANQKESRNAVSYGEHKFQYWWNELGGSTKYLDEEKYINDRFDYLSELISKRSTETNEDEKKNIDNNIKEVFSYLESKSKEFDSQMEGLELDYIPNAKEGSQEAKINEIIEFVDTFNDKLLLAEAKANGATSDSYNRIFKNAISSSRFSEAAKQIEKLKKTENGAERTTKQFNKALLDTINSSAYKGSNLEQLINYLKNDLGFNIDISGEEQLMSLSSMFVEIKDKQDKATQSNLLFADSFSKITSARKAFEEGLSSVETGTEDFASYADSYEKAMELLNKGYDLDNGVLMAHVERLISDKQLKKLGYDADKVKAYLQEHLKGVFGDKDTDAPGNGLIDKIEKSADENGKIYAKDKNGNIDKTRELASYKDGNWHISDDTKDIEALGKEFGMTTDQILSCIKAMKTFSDVDLNDTETIINQLKEENKVFSVTDKKSKKSAVNISQVESDMEASGQYSSKDIFDTIQQLKDDKNVITVEIDAKSKSSKVAGELEKLGILSGNKTEGIGRNQFEYREINNIDKATEALKTFGLTGQEAYDKIKDISIKDQTGQIVSDAKKLESVLKEFSDFDIKDFTTIWKTDNGKWVENVINVKSLRDTLAEQGWESSTIDAYIQGLKKEAEKSSNKIVIDTDIDFEEDPSALTSVEEMLAKAGVAKKDGDVYTVDVEQTIKLLQSNNASSDDATAFLQNLQAQADKANSSLKLEFTTNASTIEGAISNVYTGAAEVKNNIDAANVSLDTYNNKDLSGIREQLGTTADEAYRNATGLSSANNEADKLNGREIIYSVIKNEITNTGGTGDANGTANISGTALAGGNWGTAPGGKTLTGELG